MLGRRFVLIVAVLMGLTAVAASLAPPDPRVRTRAEPTASPLAAPAPPTPPTTISADETGQRVVVREGELLELEVEGSELDSVSLEGLSKIDIVDPDAPARFTLLAEEPDEYPIVLLEADREIGRLVIRAGR